MSTTEPGPVKVWDHTRKGRLVGRIVSADSTWSEIELAEDHPYANAGERITVRTAFLTEVAP